MHVVSIVSGVSAAAAVLGLYWIHRGYNRARTGDLHRESRCIKAASNSSQKTDTGTVGVDAHHVHIGTETLGVADCAEPGDSSIADEQTILFVFSFYADDNFQVNKDLAKYFANQLSQIRIKGTKHTLHDDKWKVNVLINKPMALYNGSSDEDQGSNEGGKPVLLVESLTYRGKSNNFPTKKSLQNSITKEAIQKVVGNTYRVLGRTIYTDTCTCDALMRRIKDWFC